jgi:hypothetical protein
MAGARGGGGGMAGSSLPALDSKENMLCVVDARVMGVSMVIAAWGEGVNVCLCPPPLHRITCRLPKMRLKMLAGALTGAAPNQ